MRKLSVLVILCCKLLCVNAATAYHSDDYIIFLIPTTLIVLIGVGYLIKRIVHERKRRAELMESGETQPGDRSGADVAEEPPVVP
jgi:hypothetical protein